MLLSLSITPVPVSGRNTIQYSSTLLSRKREIRVQGSNKKKFIKYNRDKKNVNLTKICNHAHPCAHSGTSFSVVYLILLFKERF